MNIFSLFQSKDSASAKPEPTMHSHSKQSVLVIGLGNPGRKYEQTRHNAGFMLVDYWQQNYTFSAWKKERNYEICEGTIDKLAVTMIKPQTYMNKSGEALAKYLKYHSQPQKITIVQDDIDMRFSKVKMQSGGGDGGHKGVRSLKEHYKGEMTRIKIGVVSRSVDEFRKANPVAFVTSKFNEDEQSKIDALFEAIDI